MPHRSRCARYVWRSPSRGPPIQWTARTGLPPVLLAELLNLLEGAGAVRLRGQVEPADPPLAAAEAVARATDLARHHRSVDGDLLLRFADVEPRALFAAAA